MFKFRAAPVPFFAAALAGFSLLVFSAVPAAAGEPKAKPATLVLKVDVASKTPKDIKKLQKDVKKVKGVTNVKLNKKKGELTVKHNPTATPDLIKEAVTKAGFALVADEGGGEAAPAPAPEPEAEEAKDEAAAEE